ncbi:FAD-binding and (Fe-S)-binding domain-containing protein [Corynebacterium alimapuense]|uniref:D-lactate dehydrogenase (cytochrome) n=1 Tax=Corynebacterium alimapuense TaxID=1576874 RepID=A0A3M8KAM3_9CORY|nr:FAD-binding and (Fe-S)-binding domain-containing protein [Corynebacterium alimapuense]RNE49845.1 FAD-binding oxidoreductase [Corynebacterium alimapuense]
MPTSRSPMADSSQIVAELGAALSDPQQVKDRLIDRVAYASDASHYLYTPQAVVIANNAREIGEVFRVAKANSSPVTLRAGGTSLAGQSSGDGILLDVRRHFRDIEVLDGGRRVRVEPGATVRQINARLAPFGRKLGPDPASEAACTIGGVIANNSSGMACGTEFNTYQTLESMVFVLPSGTVIDSAAADAENRLKELEPELFDTLVQLQRRVRSNPESVAVIEKHFALKNTMGYGLNSFLDHDSPVALLTRLIIGSEGTLAFVAEAVFSTVAVSPLISTALAVFPNLDAATRALPDLVDSGAATLEVMDATSLRVGQQLPGVPQAITGFEVDNQAALLIEYHALEAEELEHKRRLGTNLLADLELYSPAALSADPVARAAAWGFRKGLYASVAGARTSGTTALLEDIAVPVPELASTCESLQELFARHGYADSVIFGHAKDGNIHFMLTDRFEGDQALGRYHEFNESMVDLVLGVGGNLKAEHGTGRAMAPYVRRQYGDELYEVMVELKHACDPTGMLNPGVILDEDPKAHVRNIKLAESVEKEVDRCVECGYCEPVCPSKDLTLTPRQRIVVRRAQAAAQARGDKETFAELEKEYDYDGVQTCAVDGMCQTACPVQINTADLVRRLRQETAQPALAGGWNAAAKSWGTVTRVGSVALSAAAKLPTPLVKGVTTVGRTILDDDVVPEYHGQLPGGGSARRGHAGLFGAQTGQPQGVFLPACVNSMFGPEDGELGVTEAFRRLLVRADVALTVPDNIESLCCGTPWSSKGYAKGHQTMQDRVVKSVLEATDGGRLPVISDASSCTEGFAKLLEGEDVELIDSVSFVARNVLPFLEVTEQLATLTLHPTCSTTHLGIDGDLQALGQAAAAEVHVPQAWGCCAFAGDRGMLHPELTASATAPEAAEVAEIGAENHASCNRTCEIGMTRTTGTPYVHILETLEKTTRTGV